MGHVFHRCSEYKRPLTWFHPGKRGDISSVVKFLRLNPKAFSFSDQPDIVDPEGVPWKLRGGQEVHFPILSLGPSVRRGGRRLAVSRYLLGLKLLCLPLVVHHWGGPFPQSGDMLYPSPILDSVWCRLGNRGRTSSKVGRQPSSVMA